MMAEHNPKEYDTTTKIHFYCPLEAAIEAQREQEKKQRRKVFEDFVNGIGTPKRKRVSNERRIDH